MSNTELPPLPECDASTVGLGAVWNRHSMEAYARAAIAAQAGKSEPVATVAHSFRGRAEVLLCNGDSLLPFGTELFTHPAPVRQPLTMSVNEFATQLKCAGWKDTGDAQWDGLAKLMKELGATHD